MPLLDRDDYSISLDVDGEPFDLTESGAEHWLLRHLLPAPHAAGTVWGAEIREVAREHLRQEHAGGQEDDGGAVGPAVVV